jgi:hypothetical protein
MAFAEGSLLAQTRPNNTTDNVAYTCGELPTEVMLIAVCNNTAGAIAARIYHDDAAAGLSIANAIWYDKAIPANETLYFQATCQGGGLHMKKSGTIGIRSATANALTFSIYGVTAQVAQRVGRGVGGVQ